MRKWIEPTARNLLRRPLVLGVPSSGLLGVSFVSLTAFTVGGGTWQANVTALGLGVGGYAGLRILSRFAKTGWDEAILFQLEKWKSHKQAHVPTSVRSNLRWSVSSPDTLTQSDLLLLKDEVLERVRKIRPKDNLTLQLSVDSRGAELSEIETSGQSVEGLLQRNPYVYSLYQLPVTTDPLWLFSLLSPLSPQGNSQIFTLWLRFRGVDARQIKRRIELVRRSNANLGSPLHPVDSEISFEEASLVLQGLSRGDDSVLEASMVLTSSQPLDLDTEYFVEETRWRELALKSVLGVRKRLHRSHLLRAVSASDLTPNVIDPLEQGPSFLATLRGQPLYFSPQDGRLEALHWVVVGASGSGKSFFTGLVLKRLIEVQGALSVLFVDHNRSFRRLVRSAGGSYYEPHSLSELNQSTAQLTESWNQPGTLTGLELSELPLSEKKTGAQAILSWFESFLRHRESSHPVYLVLDECWNFLREEPALIQRAFREYRKLNGAVVAITQSLGDFLSDQSGQSIFQNAPIRILLRQGEDLSPYQSALSLNPVELERLPRLRQNKGEFSEVLIKTPYLSRIGRLYPTADEHELLRTDNLRQELVTGAKRLSVSLLVGIISALGLFPAQSHAFLGTELAPLLQLVSGQVQEIQRLAENVGVARDQLQTLRDLNEGVNQTVRQIQTIQTIVERTQGTSPRSVRTMADVNALIEEAKGTQEMINDLLWLKVKIADQAIERSALQADTAYRMGQEMASTGAQLATDSQHASPGRAAQISAASSSAQMLGQGVQLQTLAQIAELQALLLELQQSQIRQSLAEERARKSQFLQQLKSVQKRRRS